MPRLIDVLPEHDLSGGAARRALQSGKVFLDGVPTADGGRDVDVDRVQVRLNAPRLTPGRDLAVLYRDDDIVVIWKPAGMLSVPAGRSGGHVNAVGIVRRLFDSAIAVHRLDEDTSGVMLVARTEEAAAALKDQWAEHDVERRYHALVVGHLGAKPRRITSQVVRDRGDGLRGSISPVNGWRGLRKRLKPDHVPDRRTARECTTTVRRLETAGAQASLVEAVLETGRTHQVRIHLSELGHPVLGETLYAARKVQHAAPRLALHAAVLGFQHPRTGQPKRFAVPLADDLEKVRRTLVAGDNLMHHSGRGKRKRR